MSYPVAFNASTESSDLYERIAH